MPGFPSGVRSRQRLLTRVFLTATGLNDWACPASVSEVEVVDCFGSGLLHGGAFARKNKVSVTGGTNIPYYIGASTSGQATWFKTNTTVKAASASGASAGTAAASIGDLKYSGGNAGNGETDNPLNGGGAGGPNGSGLPGGLTSGGAPNGGVGGGAGGAAKGGLNVNGDPGTASPIYGAGLPGPGGGGGNAGGGGLSGGAGANYGGGGGVCTDGTNGAGGQGLIVLEFYL